MKVLYDSQIFGMQDYGGISRLFSEVISRLKKNKIDNELPFFIHHNDYVPSNFGGTKDNLFPKCKLRNYFYTSTNIIFSLSKIIFGNYDLFHPTYYETYFLPFIGKRKYVITVFDLIHEKYSFKYNKFSQKLHRKKYKLLKKATHIITISKNTKKDILKFYRINPKKISVIYLANSLKSGEEKHKLDLPEKYVLFVGQRRLYKNFDIFIKAMKGVIKQNPSIHIVCAGGNKFTFKENNFLIKCGLDKITHYIPFSADRDLSEMYARSLVFVYPSLYEGFGIPILEAFSSETPVALSKRSSFPEIAGKAAVYFDPGNKNSIFLAIIKILNNQDLRHKLVTEGKKRLKLFSWDKTYIKTIRVYKKVLSQTK